MRIMASSWRTVIGMLERMLDVRSDTATRLRIETKCEDSFSVAAAERRGAQRLKGEGVSGCGLGYRVEDREG